MSLPVEKAEQVFALLLEGNRVSTVVTRLTGVHQKAILKLQPVLAGEKCERIMATRIVNVPVRDVEFDELWNFVGKKQKRVPPRGPSELGRLLHVRHD